MLEYAPRTSGYFGARIYLCRRPRSRHPSSMSDAVLVFHLIYPASILPTQPSASPNLSWAQHRAVSPNVQDEPRPWLARSVLLGARIVTATVVGSGALLGIFEGASLAWPDAKQKPTDESDLEAFA